MKRLITLFLLFMSFGLFAQLDVTIGTGTVQNPNTSYPAPYGNWYWGARHQFIIPAAEIIAAGGYAGNILALAFDVAAVQGTPLQNFEIRMGTTTATSLVSWQAGPFAQHHLTPLYTEVLGWNTHTFSTPFYWDGTSSLIVESCFNNSAYTYNAVVNQTTTTYTSSIYYFTDAATVCTTIGSSTALQRPNMKLTFAPNAPLDAGISAINSPVPPAAPGSHAITATLNNYGTDTLTSCTVNWSVNGVLQAPYAWTGSLPSTMATAPLPLGSFNFPQGNNNIKVWSSAPNNGTDGFNGNDTNEVTMFFSAPFMGTYTIGGPTADFQSLAAAYSAMSLSGMGGPVTFSFDPAFGPYAGGFEMGTVPGSSATNIFTLEGNGATIEAGSPTFILAINGLSWVNINNFNIVNPIPANNKFGIMVRGGVQHINITNNYIDVGTTSISSLTAGIAVSNSTTSATMPGDNGKYINISNNEIIGGYYGITLMGAPSYLNCFGNTVADNIVRDFYQSGIYLSNNDTTVVTGNNISRGTRTTLTTFYGIYATTSRNIKYIDNMIHSSGVGSYGAYPFYITESVNSLGYETEFINNLVYNIPTTSTFYAMYFLNTRNHIKMYHNTVHAYTSASNTTRALFMSGAPDNHDLKNNIFAVDGPGTGTKHCIYVATTSATFTANNNNYYMGATAGTNYVGFWGANNTSLSDWQLASSQDANAVNANPVFASIITGNMTPLATAIDNLGTPVGVTTDFYGNPRSATTPDLGAIEFTGVSADLALIGGSLVNGECLSANDSVYITIANVVGATVNFSTATTTVHWSATGPVSSSGTIVINSGTLAVGTNLTVGGTGVNMSLAGTYHLSAYISANAVNLFGGNDTLNEMSSLNILNPFYVTPKHVVITNPLDTVEISAKSTFFPGGAFFMSEVCHWRGSGTGVPVGGWPPYLIADDYIEITGVPNSDLGGYTLEQWSTTAMIATHTFPPGTVMGPNGTAIIAVGQMGVSVPSPANFYYHGDGGVNHVFGSTITAGRILKDGTGNIVDAVGYGTYTFPAAANVTPADWSGNTPGISSAGNRLVGPYTKDATNWINSGVSPQDPNTVNAGVTLPSPGTLSGFTWSTNGVVTATNVVDTVVGPWSTSGVYHYVASYVTPCGTLTDTVTVHVALFNILQGDTTICQGDTATIEIDLPGTAPWTVVGTDGYGVDTMTVTSSPWISYVNPQSTNTYTLLSFADSSNVFLDVNISITITVIPGPTVTLPAYSPVCIGDSAFMLTGGMPSGGIYGGPGVAAGVFDPFSAGPGTHFITYTYADLTTGCSSTAAEQIFVDSGPDGTLTADHDICEGESTILEIIIPGAGSPSLIFSEYIEGTSNNKALEIFNATPDTLDLADYRIAESVNGGGWAYWHYFPTGAKLAPHTTWVMVANQVSATYYDTAYADEVLAFPSVVHYNGNDARAIEVTADGGATWTIIDIIGEPNINPGTGWAVAGVNNATADKTLIRKPEIFAGNTNWAAVAGTDSLSSEYTVYPVNYFANLGSHTFIPPAGGNYTYAWSTSATTPSITVSPTVTTTYTVTVSSPGSTCDNILMVVVTVNPAPAVNLGANFDVCDDGTATIDAGTGFASYMWSTGATTHAITVSGATIGLGNTATFTVTVTDANGCEGISSVNVTAIDCSNINDPDMKSALTFWPNPNDGNFFIRIKGITGDATLRISNVTGQTISVENLTLNDEWVKEFNLGNLAPGIYFVRLNTKTDVVTKQIIIK